MRLWRYNDRDWGCVSTSVYQQTRMQEGHPTATSGHRTARRKRLDDLERIMRMVSSAIPIITFRYYPYKQRSWPFGSASFFLIVARFFSETWLKRVRVAYGKNFWGMWELICEKQELVRDSLVRVNGKMSVRKRFSPDKLYFELTCPWEGGGLRT